MSAPMEISKNPIALLAQSYKAFFTQSSTEEKINLLMVSILFGFAELGAFVVFCHAPFYSFMIISSGFLTALIVGIAKIGYNILSDQKYRSERIAHKLENNS